MSPTDLTTFDLLFIFVLWAFISFLFALVFGRFVYVARGDQPTDSSGESHD
jgi:hypothetical protein